MNREQWLRNVELRGCEKIPGLVVFSPAVQKKYKGKLDKIVKKCPSLFEGYAESESGDSWGNEPRYQGGKQWTDHWGCIWKNIYDGMEGVVIHHPLKDWKNLRNLKVPNPSVEDDMAFLNWENIAENIRRRRRERKIASGKVTHGFLFQRLYYLRGFENLMIDIALRDERLNQLINIVLEYNEKLVKNYLKLGVDVIFFGDDLGMQTNLLISPEDWRRYIKPAYAEIFSRCRDAGIHVYFHSDGYIVDIMSDLIEIGVTILNPQDLCNGLENIKKKLKAKVCIDLDIDRQKIIPWGTPEEIDSHIFQCVKTLYSPNGGLMLICGIYPGTPFDNIKAVCEAMNKYCLAFKLS